MKEYLDYKRELLKSKHHYRIDEDYFEIRNKAPKVALTNGCSNEDDGQQARKPKSYGLLMEQVERSVRYKIQSQSQQVVGAKLSKSKSITPIRQKQANPTKKKSFSARKSLCSINNIRKNIDQSQKESNENKIDKILTHSIGKEIKFLIVVDSISKNSQWYPADKILQFLENRQQLTKLTNYFYSLKSNSQDRFSYLLKAIKRNGIYENLDTYLSKALEE